SCRLFFFHAEDGIRDDLVTGVQTCALPIWSRGGHTFEPVGSVPLKGLDQPVAAAEVVWVPTGEDRPPLPPQLTTDPTITFVGREIGRASCRERVNMAVRARSLTLEENSTES